MITNEIQNSCFELFMLRLHPRISRKLLSHVHEEKKIKNIVPKISTTIVNTCTTCTPNTSLSSHDIPIDIEKHIQTGNARYRRTFLLNEKRKKKHLIVL